MANIQRTGQTRKVGQSSKKETREELFESLNGLDTNLETEAEALAKLRAERSNVVKKIMEEHGRGPHEIEGKSMIIANRGDTYFFRESTAGKKRGPRTKKNKAMALGLMRGDTTGDIYILYPYSATEYAIQLLEPDVDKWVGATAVFACTNLEEAEAHLARTVHSREEVPARPTSGKQAPASKPSLEASMVS